MYPDANGRFFVFTRALSGSPVHKWGADVSLRAAAGRCQAMEMTVSVYESSEFRLILPKQTEVARTEKNFVSEDCRVSRGQGNTSDLRPNPSTARPLVVFRDLDLFRRLVLSAGWMRSHVAIAGIKEQAAANNCAKH
jgi:hypothetical protein